MTTYCEVALAFLITAPFQSLFIDTLGILGRVGIINSEDREWIRDGINAYNDAIDEVKHTNNEE